MDYRVHVPRNGYSGSDPKKREKARRENQLCHEIEVELQRRYDALRPGEISAIMAHSVAWAIDRDVEQVRVIMCRIQGGSNGVTFGKEPLPGHTWEQAAEALTPPPQPTQPETPDGKIKLGNRVRHQIFGEGTVTHIAGQQLDIAFDGEGEKRVVASFVKPVGD